MRPRYAGLPAMQQLYEEALLVPAIAPVLHADERMTVSVESATHYIMSIHAGTPAVTVVMFAGYIDLRESAVTG